MNGNAERLGKKMLWHVLLKIRDTQHGLWHFVPRLHHNWQSIPIYHICKLPLHQTKLYNSQKLQ